MVTRRLAREEALLVGGSSGMAAAAAIQLAHEIDDPDAVIVVLLPDGGRGYLTKVFDDDWLAQYGFLGKAGSLTVGDVLRGKDGRLPDLVHTHPNETIAEAVAILREYAVSQMPVVRAEPPVMAAEVAGSVSDRELLAALYAGDAKLADRVEDHMARTAADHRCARAGDGGRREAPRRRRSARAGRRQAGRCARPGRTCSASSRWSRRTPPPPPMPDSMAALSIGFSPRRERRRSRNSASLDSE